MRMSELQEDIRHREMTIRNCEDQISQLQSGVNDMSKELEMKGKEILRIRSEANQAAKCGNHCDVTLCLHHVFMLLLLLWLGFVSNSLSTIWIRSCHSYVPITDDKVRKCSQTSRRRKTC